MENKRSSIRTKMYIFVIITILAVAFGTSAIAFTTGANQINRYYEQNAADNARNFASMVDGDFLKELREVAAFDEFQELREQAEEEDNEKLIEDYLREKGLWERYNNTRRMITTYLGNMKGIKYLYIIAHGDANADRDMYLVDDEENPIYETGYYEDRETELEGIDLTNMPKPRISNGDWGWLCSDFKPVYSSDGECVCIVGCDIGMDDVMAERRRLLLLLIAGTIAITAVVLVAAVYFINKAVVTPLNSMSSEMKKFTPAEGLSYEEAGVIDIDIKSNDEIEEIYQSIRNMQIRIIDYLRDMLKLQEDNKKAENDLKNKEEEIDQLSIETYKDALTGVGNKAAYNKKIAELNEQLKESDIDFSMVMVDINNLKHVNDEYGHKNGDMYIKGCCHMISDVFRYSPVYRIGGDEFIVILFGSDYENRIKLCKKLKDEFRATYEQQGIPAWLRYSAAVGMADKAADNPTTEFVFKAADEEMYKDKGYFKEKYGENYR